MKSRSLADQGARACDSVILCMSEGHSRVGLDRADLFRNSRSFALELGDVLRIAEVRELITHEEVVLGGPGAQLGRRRRASRGPASSDRLPNPTDCGCRFLPPPRPYTHRR